MRSSELYKMAIQEESAAFNYDKVARARRHGRLWPLLMEAAERTNVLLRDQRRLSFPSYATTRNSFRRETGGPAAAPGLPGCDFQEDFNGAIKGTPTGGPPGRPGGDVTERRSGRRRRCPATFPSCSSSLPHPI